MLSTLEMVRALRWVGKDRRRLAVIVQRDRLTRTLVVNDMARKGIKCLDRLVLGDDHPVDIHGVARPVPATVPYQNVKPLRQARRRLA